MTSVAVIQARTNSKRLPGKSLLDLRGLPIAVLAAKRAANRGQRVVIATSSESSDDALADTIARHKLDCFRGSLNDPLKRFVDALRDYDDESVVFRLTADNVLPDGNLLAEMEDQFRSEDLDYLCCESKTSGLPYGLSVEVTRLKHLREAERKCESLSEREHVTPYIIKKFGRTLFVKYADLRMGHYRCTIDCLDDYISMQRLLDGCDDPINVNYLSLLPRLIGQPLQPVGNKLTSKFIFGAAQLGLVYGIANEAGQPSQDAAIDLIRTAITSGTEGIDTARSYGISEEVIGLALNSGWEGRARVTTKLSTLDDCPDAAPTAASINAFVDASVFHSMSALQVKTIDILLLHRASHLLKWDGAIWRRVIEHRDEGRIGELGVSVQTPEELELALSQRDVAHIQLPYNLLDWRWDKLRPKILAAKDIRNLQIQVRSALLQGLLVSSDDAHWHCARIFAPQSIRDWLDSLRNEFGRSSIADLCIAFTAGITWIDGVVVGLETMEQLRENITLFENPPLTEEQIQIVTRTRPILDEQCLDPSRWRTG